MATNAPGVRIELSANAARLKRDMDAARNTVDVAARGFSSALSSIRGGFAAIAGAMAFNVIVAEASKAEQEMNRFNALVRISGEQAGLTRAELEGMGKALEDSSHFDDEDILRGQSTLLKFGNIQKDVFTEAMKLAADYAAFTGGTFADGAQAVGRALQSPAQGLKALQLELGKLTPTQKEHIEKLMEQNKLAEAQGVILEFVRGKVGGVAKEMNQGFLARTAAMTKEMGNLMEAIGKTFVGNASKSVLGFAAQTLKDMRVIVEDGDWVEKLLGVLAMAGGMRGLNLTKQAPTDDRPGSVSGKIGGLPPGVQPGLEPTAEFLEKQKKAREKAAKERKDAIAEVMKGDHEAMRARFDDKADLDAWIAQLELNKRKEMFAMHKRGEEESWIARWEKFQDDGIAEGVRLIEAQKNAAKEITEFWRSAAQNMQSSMSNLFFDVMQGNLSDLAGSFKRTIDRTVADMLAAKAATALFGADFGKGGAMGGIIGKGLNWLTGGGSAGVAGINEMALPALASGTPFVPRDGPAYLHRGEAVIPAAENNGGGRGMSLTVNFMLQGALDRRSQDQAATLVGERVQRALARNT